MRLTRTSPPPSAILDPAPRKTGTRRAAEAGNGRAPHLPAATVRSVCVYCGSGAGAQPLYGDAARTLGRSLAEAGIRLIYGGGGLGLMGEVARATLEAGGKVTGIIPGFLVQREHMLREVTDLVVTADMHERKKLMFERSDAFVALPGGIGTLEELVEQLTWAQLGQHTKPIVVANIGNFWSPFLKLLDHMRDQAFIRAGLEVRFGVVDEARDIVPKVRAIYAETGGTVEPGTLSKF
jgi:uncharacterized protein (TIGR00730 family)